MRIYEKIYIKIPREIDFKRLSRNKIMMMIYLLRNNKGGEDERERAYREFVSKIYRTNRVRAEQDRKEILSKYGVMIKRYRDLDKHTTTKKFDYNKIKVKTFNALCENKMTKSDLLLILWLLGPYQNNIHRVRTFKVIQLLTTIYGPSGYNKKSRLIESLENILKIKYEDGTKLLVSYDISGYYITLNLDPK